jgi:ABC-type Fe3+/spermidine/putrescine transport system ATPase subunit
MQQTAMYVTHDQEEAFTIADRVVVMRSGCVEQSGTPQEIYNHPASPFVAGFIGLTNLVSGSATPAGIETPVGWFPNPGEFSGPVTVLIRPEVQATEADCRLEGTVVERSFRGRAYRLTLEVNGIRLGFELPSDGSVPAEGQIVQVCLEPKSSVQVFPGGNDPGRWTS